jgi:tetratricopeptide (TPR) repeat protein
MSTSPGPEPSPQLARLLGFLKSDPGNVPLATDAARLAFDEKNLTLAASILDGLEAATALPSGLVNLKGCIALAEGRFEDAAPIFAELLKQSPDDPALRFNLAWAMARLGHFEQVAELLDDAAIAASPEAPALKIWALHHLERYDEALQAGEQLAQRYPNNQALMGALATLAMDAERADLSRHYAERAGANAEGRAALGLLALGEQDATLSVKLFDEALAKQQDNPRALIGKGLALMSTGDVAAGAKALDRGAEIFRTHLGSWVAAGWAYYVAGDYSSARARFEQAIAIDPNFGESHGGLAVIDIAEGKLEDARRRADIALRLDRKSFGGALAKSLLLDKEGRSDAAQRVRALAFATPVGIQGRTLGQELAALGAKAVTKKT